jgi:hypothetical protein
LWILCSSLAFVLVAPVGHAAARTGLSISLRIGDRYRGPVLFREEPAVTPVGRGVYYVRDADQDVYRYGDYWYLNYNGDWYRADSYRGPWIFVGYQSVPRQVYSVPTSYRRTWRDYRDRHYWRRGDNHNRYSARGGVGGSFTLRIGDRYNGPDLGFYDTPSLVRVPGRGVYYVQDSDFDVYRYGNYWYMNYNGDWYRAGSYRGPWIFVGYQSVPSDVYGVPTQYRHRWSDYHDQHYESDDRGGDNGYGRGYNGNGYGRGYYGRGGNGYRSDNGYNGGGVGISVSLHIGDRYDGPDLGFTSQPVLETVPGGRGVAYVRDSDNDVYRYGSTWYMNYNGDWYRASSYSGPWVFVGYRSVPRDVYSVPTSYRRGWSDYRDQHYDWSNNDGQ